MEKIFDRGEQFVKHDKNAKTSFFSESFCGLYKNVSSLLDRIDRLSTRLFGLKTDALPPSLSWFLPRLFYSKVAILIVGYSSTYVTESGLYDVMSCSRSIRPLN